MQISTNALSAGLTGFQAGQQKVERAALEIADAAATTPAADLSAAAIEMRVGQHQAEAASKVIRTADEVLGTLIDLRA